MTTPLGFDTRPDREIVLKKPRLYFAWRAGVQYALIATDTDEARSIPEDLLNHV